MDRSKVRQMTFASLFVFQKMRTQAAVGMDRLQTMRSPK
jgi:hypothetical protein